MSLLDALWYLDLARLFISLWGTLFCFLELHDLTIDLRVAREQGHNGIRYYVAKMNISNEALRLALQVIFVTLAVIGVIWPLTVSTESMVPTRLVIGRALLILGTIILAVKSWLDRQTRSAVKVYWMGDVKRNRRSTDNDTIRTSS